MYKSSTFHNSKKSDINLSEINVVYKERKTMPWKHDRKTMASYYLGYIIEGSLIVISDGESFEVNVGELIFIEKNKDFHSRSRKLPFSFISIEFDIYEDKFYNFEFKRLFKLRNPEKFQSYMEEIYIAWNDNRTGANLRQKSLMYRIFDCILNEYSTDDQSYEMKKIKKAVDYMDKNYFCRYTDIEELADMCEISASSFTRMFKKIYNTTPTKYMNFLRIERAKQLLYETDMQITAISETCGFSSTYYFSRLFKQTTGESPLKYRQKHFKYLQ